MPRSRWSLFAALVIAASATVATSMTTAAAGSFLGHFSAIRVVGSTVPRNGDVNPYGTVVVQRSIGDLVAGDVLVSNFNDRANLQGTGTTLVEVSPSGGLRVFARIRSNTLPGPCPGGVGLTTALAILPHGFVVVGSLPTTDGTAATAAAGCLLVLNSSGTVVETVAGRGINGPWDMTAVNSGDDSTIFVTNVLNGTVHAAGATVNRGTVVRFHVAVDRGEIPRFEQATVVAAGFGERTDPAALVVGPTGLALSRDGTLFVADTVDNRIAAIPHALTRAGSAGTGFDVTANGLLNAPLGLTIAPGGDVLTVNGGDGNIVEVTPPGAQIAHKLLDSSASPPGAGALFGLAIAPSGTGVYFVDDATNTLDLLH
jgi:sugar lactone lactonase YvrE